MKKRAFNIFIAIIIILSWFIFRPIRVKGISMEDTYSNGDILIAERVFNKLYYDRFDVIVFRKGGIFSEKIIKRIIGLPGETVEIKGGNVFINGAVIADKYGKGHTSPIDIVNKKIELKEDEFFVLGDNRENSGDSRYEIIGPVKKKEVVGRIWARIWPISP